MTPTSFPQITLKNLFVRYSDTNKWILQDINLALNGGEFILIAGASGSGKSTLAKTLLALLETFKEGYREGSVIINNKSLDELQRIEFVQQIGYVPQYPADFTVSLLVEEEIAFPMENLGIAPYKIIEDVDSKLSLLHISHLKDRLIIELSSGELQRVEIATAMATNPRILILDEPMARIDPRSERVLARDLRRLAEEGYLILVFEHRISNILNKAHRLIILEEGKIVSDGHPFETLDQLRNVDLPDLALLDKRLLHEEQNLVKHQIVDKLSKTRKSLTKKDIPRENKSTNIITFDEVRFRYDSKSSWVLDNLSFSIKTGQIIGLLGANGSGKSTLLKLIAGILNADEGSYYLGEKKVKKVRHTKNEVIYIPENAKLFLVGPTPLDDLTKLVSNREKAQILFEANHLDHLMNRKIYHMSEGERRLMALFIAFHSQAKILLLDEPTIGMDKKGRALFEKMIKKAQKGNKIVIIASNDNRINSYTTDLMVLSKKKKMVYGKTRDVLYSLNDYPSLFPNQVVNLILELEDHYNVSLPHPISINELKFLLGE